MDSLTTYVNNTFSAVPQTEEIKKLKAEILNRMLYRYNELKSEGKNDNESTGIIISEFSNISELINEQINNHNINNSSYNNEITINNINSEKKERIIRAILSSYWPTVVAVYFLLSFTLEIWDISWIIFLIAPAVRKFLSSYYDN
ncbi:hypothetical protein [Clostridium sp. SM-530-WT-3G]|uniref:hypothetical protein n=1 Tax=Clostridium sp. SM-530-WT-3G TaxID=2725303 RepID=UPI00145FBFC8|nr:hypothetical protein [Clostridium sp. SM-530-WT-3G]NME82012.1 hypothetical protein [Clostridium sp. SM-530-WT-3G]